MGEVETHRRCSFEGCLCFDIGGAREEWNRISREGKRSGRRLDGCLCCCFSSRPHSLSSRAQTRRFSPHVNQIFSVLRHSGVSGMLFYDCFSEFEITMKWKAFSRWESLHAIPILSNHTYTDGILGGTRGWRFEGELRARRPDGLRSLYSKRTLDTEAR